MTRTEQARLAMLLAHRFIDDLPNYPAQGTAQENLAALLMGFHQLVTGEATEWQTTTTRTAAQPRETDFDC